MVANRGQMFVLSALALWCHCNAMTTSSRTTDAELPVSYDGMSLLSVQSVTRRAAMSAQSVHSRSMHAKVRQDSMPLVAWRAFESIAEGKRLLLDKGSAPDAKPSGSSVFEAVQVSLPLEPPVLKHSRDAGAGQGDKNIVGLAELTRGGRKCVVYGIGIADDSGFEQQMQQMGCETHAFDCTLTPDAPSVKGKSFKFHNWCIGHKAGASFKDNTYLHADEKSMEFKSLTETMKELGHSHIDLLKFDIEGFEWQLFQSQLLNGSSEKLPEQLSFELHTQKANPAYVPHENVKDKGFVQVNELFRALYDKGYRVTSKEINSGDPACAEFVAVNVNRDDA
jgi:hypothetical protein